jgi:Integrase core domain
MSKTVSVQARRELVQALRSRYRASLRTEKTRILQEFASISGYHRKSAIRILNGSCELYEPSLARHRPRLYDEAVRQALIVLWEASDRVCGKRLKALLPVLLPALERHERLRVDPAIHAKLTAISAATIDRLLREVRSAGSGGRARRAPTALRRSVPIRTFADWGDPPPGYMEMDLVAHSGETAAGSYVHTLSLTDVFSGWTECVPLLVRESTLVIEAIDGLRCSLPFMLRGLDVDNGSEFLNDALVRYCVSHGIEFTRSRPYHKNDQAWIEQKNGAVVRRMVGYRRFEGMAAVAALSRLYTASRLFVNFFQPSFKLKEKQRLGSRIIKRYHAPATPYARLVASSTISEQVKSQLNGIAETLDPLQLLDEIRRMQSHLALLSEGGHPHTPVAQQDDLSRFLSGLSTAWHQTEVRATHCKTLNPPRHWRTRKDPFETAWGTIQKWLEVDPDQTGKDLFRRLQHQHPDVYPDSQLRTLQRRLKEWRGQMVRKLVFGVQQQGGIDPPIIKGEAQAGFSGTSRRSSF